MEHHDVWKLFLMSNVVLTHLWPLVGQSLHDLWGSIEWTTTVGLQQSAPLEMIGKAKVSQLQRQRKREHKMLNFTIIMLCPWVPLLLSWYKTRQLLINY